MPRLRELAVEQTTIQCARAYADLNGYGTDDRKAAGLVLAGMAIASGVDPDAQAIIRDLYVRALPESAMAVTSWSAAISRAGR